MSFTQPTSQDTATSHRPASRPLPATFAFSDRIVLLIAFALIAIAFWNALHGEWVYDDRTQIVENHLVQDPRFFTKALVTDVWGFKGDKGAAWSNYWRPTFVLWLMVNYQLFGLVTFGWHLTSLLAHALVTWLVFRVLKELRLDPAVCAVATWIFAVHPAHVESVTWISGVTDIILSAFLLASYLFFLRADPSRFTSPPMLASLATYAFALLSKEAAVTFPAIIFFTRWIRSAPASPGRFRNALASAVPYAILVAVYIPARYLVLGQMRQTAPGAPGLVGMLATAPSVITFYLRQTFFPAILGPDNPLRPVTNSNIGWVNFVIPLAVLLLVANILWPYLRRSRAHQLGVLWFVIPVMLAVDIRVFLPDQIVNNRYLYLSVMGAFVIAAQVLLDCARSHWPADPARAGKATALCGLLMAVAMLPLTVDYNRAWCNETTLWQRGIANDPASNHAYFMLGVAYRQNNRWTEAHAALDRAIQLNPDASYPYIELARVQINDGDFTHAEENLHKVLAVRPELSSAWEILASGFEKQQRYDDAIATFRKAIDALPFLKPRYTKNIAILHYLAGRRTAALAELESMRADLAQAATEDVLEAWFYLGSLYAELNRRPEAIDALQKYLQATESMASRNVAARRNECRTLLASLTSRP